MLLIATEMKPRIFADDIGGPHSGQTCLRSLSPAPAVDVDHFTGLGSRALETAEHHRGIRSLNGALRVVLLGDAGTFVAGELRGSFDAQRVSHCGHSRLAERVWHKFLVKLGPFPDTPHRSMDILRAAGRAGTGVEDELVSA